ncbi:MAG: carbohydrate porin [Allosphingosinicella sp.]
MIRIGGLIAAALSAAPAAAQPALPAGLSVDASYIADLIGIVSGGVDRGARYLDNLEIAAEADLDEIAGWRGGRIGLRLLSNQGGNPNDLAGTLQGVDNVEVADHRIKLFELWLAQSFAGGRVDLRLGLFDLNDEFYASVASEDLLAPSFGIGPELGATGPSGPSIFPSSSLTARLLVRPADDLYVQASILNAQAGVVGDPGGIDLAFDQGLLAIGEAGWTGRGKLALGVWSYTESVPVVPPAPPARDAASGVYLLAEQPISATDAARQVEIFFRGGVAHGDTTPFRASWQAGFRVGGLIPGRPLGRLSFGIHQARLTTRFRGAGTPGGGERSAAETGFELTYVDRLAPFLTVQPDLQYVLRPAGRRDIDAALVVGLRLIFAWPGD